MQKLILFILMCFKRLNGYLLFPEGTFLQVCFSKKNLVTKMNPLHQLLLLTIIQSISCDYNLGFDKFLLLFPRYTVLQLTIGMSVPVILPNRTIVISPGIQNNFDLPYNLTNFQVVTYARSNQGFDISRDTMYGYIIGILENVGLNGEECLLRSICEVSRTPFHIEDQESVLERIAHHILTPSIEYKNVSVLNEFDPTLNFQDKLLLAEEIGRMGKKCASVYTGCLLSIVDLFSSLFL